MESPEKKDANLAPLNYSFVLLWRSEIRRSPLCQPISPASGYKCAVSRRYLSLGFPENAIQKVVGTVFNVNIFLPSV